MVYEEIYPVRPWRERLQRSGFFLIAVLLHLILFLMVATWIVFEAPVTPTATFQQVSVKVPPPVQHPPPPAGGEAFNAMEPNVTVTPPPSAPSMISISQSSLFNVHSVKVAIPNLPPSTSVATGTALSGAGAAGATSGAGSPFGQMGGDGNSEQFVGYLYDLKQDKGGRPTGMNTAKYDRFVRQMTDGSWDLPSLNQFYKGSKPLSTPAIFIPTMDAQLAPQAFGLDKEVQPSLWIIWYHAKATPPEEGDYHFVGVGDDMLMAAVDRHTVLDGSLWGITPAQKTQTSISMSGFNPTCDPNAHFWVGKSFHVRTGESIDIDVIIGEEPGGRFNSFLFIQRDQSTYDKQPNGSPLLPIFQLDPNPIKPQGEAGSYPPFAKPVPWTAGR